MASWEQVVAKVADTVLDDVVAAVKQDERYAPLVASLAQQALSAVAGPAAPASG